MTPRKLNAQSIYLHPEQAKLLDQLAEQSRIPKAVLLREAVDDMLAVNSMGDPTARVREVRNALKKARIQLVNYRKEITDLKRGLIPQQKCQEAIDAIDRAREEFGD